jgi:peptide chain release factor subunit 1
MKQSAILNKLAEIEATGFPFISVYLNAEPNEHGRDNFNAFVKKQLSEHQDNYQEGDSGRESFERDAKRITEYLENVNPSANGVAIFACAGADDFFQTIEFYVPFRDNQFYVFEKPHLYPLARLIEENPKFAVVLADTNSAAIYVFQRGMILEEEQIENKKTNRSEVGGWSQMRYQRHIDNIHEQHAKEVIGELDKIVRDENIEQIILAGNEEVVIPILRQELTKELEEKIAGTLRLDVKTPEDEVLAQARQAIRQHDTLQDKGKIDYLQEQNYDGGFGVVGVEKTLEALSNGQVQELYLSAHFDRIKFNAKKVGEVLEAYAPGEEDEIPHVSEAGEIIDELIRRGVQTADRIRFIEDENLMKNTGGVGAILRYKINGE